MKRVIKILSSQKSAILLLFLASLWPLEAKSQTVTLPVPIDVIRYEAQIEPDFTGKSVAGKVSISLVVLQNDLSEVEFDCGNLTIDAVRENKAQLLFKSVGKRVKITLLRAAQTNEKHKIEIQYHGTPQFGIKFFPERRQIYTEFSTSQWLVCIDAPADRATLKLKLILPPKLTVVASGQLLLEHRLVSGKTVSEWEQKTPVPTYTFGFAAGIFRESSDKSGKVRLRYLGAASFSEAELKRVFADTADMIKFYEKVAGVRYLDSTYTQVLVEGDAAQEMSSFAALSEDYGREVLKDEGQLWLIAHELAHQWWGNMVTCLDWRHFWLNEGMATFMAAAYQEHRFGQAKYLKEIEKSRVRYEKVKEAGKAKPLVFPDWNKPSREDRTIVYHKGAYVLHLLREELGDKEFWQAIKDYTGKYYGKSVTTIEFQKSVEETTGRDLSKFFAKWVSGDSIPAL